MNIQRAAFGRTLAGNRQGALASQGLDFPLYETSLGKLEVPATPGRGFFLERSRPLARYSAEPTEGERNRDKCRQFIRKAIRPCSRVAFSIRLYAQDEVEKAARRRRS
jgi:hypothetical protein